MTENLLLTLLVRGVGLGFSAAVLPGPLQGYVMNTALKHGWARALVVVCSPLVVDIPVILAVLLALETLSRVLPRLTDGISIVGGLFVLYLAWGAWKDFRAGAVISTDDAPDAPTETVRGTFGRAMMVNALSPGPYLFWTTVNGPLLKQALAASAGHGVAFLVAFYGTFLGLMAAFAVAIARLRTVNPGFTRWLVLVAAVLLTLFGVRLVFEGIMP